MSEFKTFWCADDITRQNKLNGIFLRFSNIIKSALKFHFTLFVILLFSGHILANNIQVANVTISGQDRINDFTLVQFDLSWENSWRISGGPSNWDAAWVFVKFQVGAFKPTFTGVSSSGNTVTVSSTANLGVGMPVVKTSGAVITAITGPTTFSISGVAPDLSNATIECSLIWEHVRLIASASNHTAVAGSTIDVPSDAKGVFIYRGAPGAGNVIYTRVQSGWEYGIDGVEDNRLVSVKVFAIEMVYVPQGSFYAGSDGMEFGSFTDGSWTSGATIPFRITSENALTIGPSVGNLWGTSTAGTGSIGPSGTLPAAFPKGFAAFYMMKYPISQQQYVDFLNTLTREQQNNRTGTNLASGLNSVTNRNVMSNTSTISARNGIRVDGTISANDPLTFYCDLNGNGTGGESGDGQWIAMNWMGYMDGTAYLDWSGLRLMTEFEYEKAARGPIEPVAIENAWGTVSIANSAYTLSNSGAIHEGISTAFSPLGNALCATTKGSIDAPLRVGIFAANPSNTGRITSGASYWGIMELSGNMWERVVTVGNAEGRAYTGLHGDGTLTNSGDANVSGWIGSDATGKGLRGGGWNSSVVDLQISDRSRAIEALRVRNRNRGGFRGVRTAP